MYEIYQESKRYYVIMEYCTGGELFDQIIKRVLFSEKEAANILRQVLAAASYCHTKGIVHRDLKPDNIVLSYSEDKNLFEDLQLKLVDFGLASINNDNMLEDTVGTPYYIAPEIL